MATHCLIEIKLITRKRIKQFLTTLWRDLLLKEGLYFSLIINLTSRVI